MCKRACVCVCVCCLQTSPARTCTRAHTDLHIQGQWFWRKIQFLFAHSFSASRSSPTYYIVPRAALLSALSALRRRSSQRQRQHEISAPAKTSPCYVLRTHTNSPTHTHTCAHSSLDVGLVLRNLRARYPRSHSRSSARDTHIPQNSRTNSFVCCVHVLRPLRSADRTYERRQAGIRQAVVDERGAETGPRVIPRCLRHAHPFLTVCPVCLCEFGHSFWSVFVYAVAASSNSSICT